MTELSLARIEKCNMNCSLQDRGRFGYKHIGISTSGPADAFAFFWANRLLGNSSDAVTIETVMGNFRIRFSKATRICVTGAKTKLSVNGCPSDTWTTVDVEDGATVDIAFPESGIYNYLAIKNGVSIEPVLGSRAMCLREGMGPLNGLALTKDQTLPYLAPKKNSLGTNVSCPWNLIPDFTSELHLRFIPGDAFFTLSQHEKDTFLSASYAVDPHSNKMGARLDGRAIHIENQNRFSQAVCAGTIQVPSSGQPIVLLADHQTIGGYPTLGTVYLSDSAQLSQRRPGQKVRFIEGTLDDAQQSSEKLLTLALTY